MLKKLITSLYAATMLTSPACGSSIDYNFKHPYRSAKAKSMELAALTKKSQTPIVNINTNIISIDDFAGRITRAVGNYKFAIDYDDRYSTNNAIFQAHLEDKTIISAVEFKQDANLRQEIYHRFEERASRNFGLILRPDSGEMRSFNYGRLDKRGFNKQLTNKAISTGIKSAEQALEIITEQYMEMVDNSRIGQFMGKFSGIFRDFGKDIATPEKRTKISPLNEENLGKLYEQANMPYQKPENKLGLGIDIWRTDPRLKLEVTKYAQTRISYEGIDANFVKILNFPNQWVFAAGIRFDEFDKENFLWSVGIGGPIKWPFFDGIMQLRGYSDERNGHSINLEVTAINW